MKKSLAVIMSVIMLSTAMAGCTQKPAGGGSKETQAQSQGETQAKASGGETAQAEAAEGTIKVGCIFPITGPNADQGIFNVDGCKLAIKQINENGGIKSLGGKKLELVVYDNQSDAEQAKAVAERLIAENPDIVAVTGAAASTYVLPMLPVFEKSEVPFLTAQVSEAITSQGYKNAFRIGSTGGSFAQSQVEFLEWLNEKYGLGLKKIGIVYEDTEWGISNTSGAVKAIEKSQSGLEIVYNQSFPANGSDLSNIVVGLKNSGCEVVFPTCYTQDAKLLFNTMASMNYDPVIIGGGGGFLYPSFAQELGEVVDGVLSVTGHNYDVKTIMDDPFLSKVGTSFEQEYGYFMPEQAVASYGGIYLMAQALESSKSIDRAAVREAVRTLTCPVVTPGSPVKFDENGSNVNAFAVMTQWQKDEDGIYRTRTVFPESAATAEFQMPESLKALIKK